MRASTESEREMRLGQWIEECRFDVTFAWHPSCAAHPGSRWWRNAGRSVRLEPLHDTMIDPAAALRTK